MHISKSTILYTVMTILSIVQAQRRVNRFGGGRGQLRNNRGLTAREIQELNRLAELENQRRRRNQLNSNNFRNARNNRANRFNRGDRLRAANNVAADQFGNVERFNNVNAAFNREQSNKFQLAINSENSFSEGSQISANSGDRLSFGNRLRADNNLAAENVAQRENLLNEEAAAADQLGINTEAEDALRARNGLNSLNQNTFDGRSDSFFNRGGFGSGFSDFGSFRPFQGSSFGKR